MSITNLLSLLYPQGGLDFKWLSAIVSLSALVVVSRAVKLTQGVEAVDSLPGFRIPFGPLTIPGGTLPITWWNPNFLLVWRWRKEKNIYRRFKNDSVSFVPFIHGAPIIFTRSLGVGRQVLTGGLDVFDKSPALQGPFQYWGPNIVDAYGSHWRKHRKISSPAFNNDTYASVWAASCGLYAQMMTSQDWASKDVIDQPSVDSITFKFSLTIFTSVGFGLPLTWSKPASQNDELHLQECLEIISKTFMFPVIAPSWVWKLPLKWIQRTRRAYEAIRVFMRSQINAIKVTRADADKGEAGFGKDLFTLLIRASEDIGVAKGLSDEELIGDVFAFLYAGHDTTAHGLSATFALLALNPDIQDEIVAQVREVTEHRDNDDLHFEDYGKLDKVSAAFYEAIRMIPPGAIVPREAKKDTVLNISDTNQPVMLSVKKGTQVVVDLVGIHYHPHYFSDPEEYRPSRWYSKKQDQTSDGKESELTAFSFGPRACIGRRYSTTEAVCFLAHFLREWHVEPLFSVRPDGRMESVIEWRERVFQVEMLVTLGMKDHGIRFVRRQLIKAK